MWARIKCWSEAAAVWIFLRAFPWMLVVDNFMINTYQRFVADPLQIRGFRLSWQVRALLAMGGLTFAFHWPFTWWNLPAGIIWIARAFFAPLAHLTEQDSPVHNAYRVMIPLIIMRVWLLWMVVLMIVTTHMYPFVFFLAAEYAEACDIKPPQPKRLKKLVSLGAGL